MAKLTASFEFAVSEALECAIHIKEVLQAVRTKNTKVINRLTVDQVDEILSNVSEGQVFKTSAEKIAFKNMLVRLGFIEQGFVRQEYQDKMDKENPPRISFSDDHD